MSRTFEEMEAARVLDLWRAGADEDDGITVPLIDWCLRVSGDAIGVNLEQRA